jgi:hypothetical protein
MRKISSNHRNSSHQQQTSERHRGDGAIASIWLMFYILAIGVVISSPFVALQVATTAH